MADDQKLQKMDEQQELIEIEKLSDELVASQMTQGNPFQKAGTPQKREPDV